MTGEVTYTAEKRVMELVKIKFGTSLFYYIYLLACVGVFLGMYFGLRKKSDRVKKWALFGVLAFNFALHFLKLAFPEYIDKGFPGIIRKCTPENICAVSTLIFPFIYLSKWKAGKDYMFYIGIAGGVLGCVAPMPALDLPFYSPEVMRYYFCHASLWQVPLLMVIFGQHKLDYRRIWKTMAMYFIVLCIIIVNELILIRIGWVGTSSLEEFFDPSGRDMGYAVGVPLDMEGVGKFILWMTPRAWKNPYVPILWELFPVIIYGGIYAVLLCSYWEHEHMRQDILTVANKIKQFISRKKAVNDNSLNGEESDD